MTRVLICVAVVLGSLVARAEDDIETRKPTTSADRDLQRLQAIKDELARRSAQKQARDDLKQQNPEEATRLETLGVFFAQVVLAKLGYGIGQFDGVLDARTQEAVREYEHTRHLAVTGDPLSYVTWHHLAADNQAYDYQPVSLPWRQFGVGSGQFEQADRWFWNSGTFKASGTWVIVGEREAVPEQTSKIDCDRKRGTCIEATAMLTRSDPKTGLPTAKASNDMNLSVDMDTYEIERWDEYEIVTKPIQFGCVRFVERFNRLQKS